MAKIVKIVNTKIENNDKEKVIIARKLLNRDIILTLDFAKTKNHMMKKTSWTTILKSQACVART